MCFVNHYDWTAELIEESTPVSDGKKRCEECSRFVPAGQAYRYIYAQEHENCQSCEWDEDCQCVDPQFGEDCAYLCCLDCSRFLEAVEAAEVAAGCRHHEARPMLTEMIESIGHCNGDQDDAKRYFKQAVAMHRDLQKSGYLGWLWRKMFPARE